MRHIAQQVALLVSLATVTRIVGVPLANSKETNGHHDDGMATTGLNQLTADDATYGDGKPAGSSNPQKRGASLPLLYREAELRNDYSGNSIPQHGVWEDVDGPLAVPYPVDLFDDEPGGGRPQRTYDVLQRLLLHRNQPLNAGPLSGGGGFPLRPHGYGDRKKRTPGPLKAHSHGHRPKRNSNKLSPAEVFSLLALMDSRDSYRPLSAIPDYMAEPPNDVLAYGPNGLYQDVSLPLALEQLLAERDEMPPSDGFAYEDAGEWMNGWTEPSVDYLGLPMGDVEALGQLKDGFFSKPSPKTGYLPQKRYMVSKKKRSAGAGCKAGDPSCSFQGTRYGTIQAAA
ncbi:uncharacterized protein LOC128274309 [Anopheles cruzii]|uniref:uncharacterized protein LOC128274309 n=1 Tax=Anopheles cruzii TaxID=68878 RepID=UPI0022EC87DB|nr:uncharacterized protein LOC128274309 [Anopheles cruzii]